MRIIVIIALAGTAFLGIVRFSRWFDAEYLTGTVAASADVIIAEAAQLLEEGNYEEARKQLRPVIERVTNPLVTPKALMLLADVERAAGQQDRAAELLQRATYEFPDSPDQPRVAVEYARLLEEEERYDEAEAVYEEVRASAPPELRAPALLGLSRAALREDKTIEARDMAQQAFKDAEQDSAVWNDALDLLGALNVELAFSGVVTPESKVYTVQRGDTLISISRKLNVTQGLLIRANKIEDPGRLHLNQRLRYVPKDFRIVIERATCRLFLMDRHGVFKRYYVGLGRQGHETSLGSYKIGNKQKDPTWHKPGSEPIPPGDPANELGTRWLPLVPTEENLPTDLGIHGTIEPDTVGTYCSSGCPRMRTKDVEELYDLVVRSTPVTIVEHR